MSDEISVTPMEPGRFGVQVNEGDVVTSHRVEVPGQLLDDLGMNDVDQERLVRETFGFLLEREPATSIMPEFSLDVVSRFFPEYPEELRARLTG